MSDKRKPAVVELDQDIPDSVIQHYAEMSDAQVDELLAKYHIDPQKTIEAVTRLVESRAATWKKPANSRNR